MAGGAAGAQVERGREAERVTDLPAAGWKDVLGRVWQEMGRDHVLLVAAGVTFYILLALVPALTALVSIYGLVADPSTLDQHMDQLRGVVPEGGLEIIREQLRRIGAQGETKLGLTSAISLGIALWSANAGMKSLFEAMNVVYHEEEKRSFLKLTAVSLVFTLSTIAAVILLLGAIVVLPAALEALGVGSQVMWALRLCAIAVVVCLMAAGLAALYRWGPSRRHARWRWITPGAVVTILVTLGASGLFSWYVSAFGSYNATYGSLGAIIGFMTWLWITASIVILGAEINSETEHQTRRDTTVGRALPLGARGAVMADSVGTAYGSEVEPDGRARAEPAALGPLPLGRLAVLLGLAWTQRRR